MSAVTDAKSGDFILKVVNASAKAIKTEIELKEAKNLTGTGTGTAAVLTSASPFDENTLENPKKVYPRTEDVKLMGAGFKLTFPGNSLTVIQFNTK